jgi:hypothetical protein
LAYGRGGERFNVNTNSDAVWHRFYICLILINLII